MLRTDPRRLVQQELMPTRITTKAGLGRLHTTVNVESLVNVTGGKYINYSNSNNGNVTTTTNTNSNNTTSGSNVPKPSRPDGMYASPSINRYSADYEGPRANYRRFNF